MRQSAACFHSIACISLCVARIYFLCFYRRKCLFRTCDPGFEASPCQYKSLAISRQLFVVLETFQEHNLAWLLLCCRLRAFRLPRVSVPCLPFPALPLLPRVMSFPLFPAFSSESGSESIFLSSFSHARFSSFTHLPDGCTKGVTYFFVFSSSARAIEKGRSTL